MRILRIGDTGTDVEYLSLALKRAGFSTGGIKNEFDSAVHNALVAFQNNQGIEADGVAGEITYSRLIPYLKGYDTVVISEGETLESLAQRFGTTEEAIRTANPLLTDFLPGASVVVPFGFDVVATDVPYSWQLVKFITEGLKARYPFVSTATAGYSVMEKSIDYLVIGTGNTKVFFNASHHANEWITTPVLLEFTEEYLKALSTGGIIADRSARELYETKTLYVLPLVNPDGVDLVTGSINPTNLFFVNARSIASNYPGIPFPEGWKANITGTDLNLNYPASWDRAREIKFAQGYVSPAPRDYVGTSPLSAQESRIIYNLSVREDFDLTVSLHTQGNVIYWKYLDYLPPRSEEIADRLAEVSGYEKEITPYASGFAGYKDWFISYYNRPGYTVEIGTGINPLPISDIESIYPPTRNLLAEALYLA